MWKSKAPAVNRRLVGDPFLQSFRRRYRRASSQRPGRWLKEASRLCRLSAVLREERGRSASLKVSERGGKGSEVHLH